MIYLESSGTTSIVRRFNDIKSLTNPYFLWELKNEFSKDIIYFNLTDTSSHNSAYNLFNFEVSTTGSTSGGTNVALNLIGGQYEYKVYESTGSTLSVSATTGVVIERDMLVVAIPRTANTIINKNVYY